MPKKPLQILFVCLGNICRSPSAEAIFRQRIKQASLEEHVVIDSAGTGPWHVGKAPDERAQKASLKRGYDQITKLRARQLTKNDKDKFDYILIMDDRNHGDVTERFEGDMKKVQYFLDYAGHDVSEKSVPDPYYDGEESFNYMLDLLEAAADGLLRHIQEQNDES